MRLAGVLRRGRAAAEALMTDTCKITKPDPDADPVWNSATGKYEQPTVTVYSGKCRIKSPALVNPFEASAPSETSQVEQFILSIPADAAQILAGMTVTYLTSTYNAGLVGHVFGVVGPHHESQATAQRVMIKENVGSGGGS